MCGDVAVFFPSSRWGGIGSYWVRGGKAVSILFSLLIGWEVLPEGSLAPKPSGTTLKGTPEWTNLWSILDPSGYTSFQLMNVRFGCFKWFCHDLVLICFNHPFSSSSWISNSNGWFSW